MVAALALSACGQGGGRQVADAPLVVPCSHDAGALTASCTVDRVATPAGWVLTLHHADGGFRRLLVTRDGRGVVAADGAQPASVRAAGADAIDAAIADDRYRLPATVRR